MKEALAFWSAATLIGFAAFPLAFAFFSRLPDRGYAFTRVVGLLVLGYALWIGATVGLFPNTRGSVVLLLVLLAAASLAAVSRNRREVGEYLRTGWRYVLFVELFFAAAFAAAVTLRSFVPEIQGGEKPFELAFLNALARNDTFPPQDPWLAGSPISYYYFGYVIVAALTNLTGLATSETFFLGLSLVGALAATAVFGVVYNLVAAARSGPSLLAGRGPRLLPRAVLFGMAGAGLLLAVSNLEGVFELMARHGVGSDGFYGKLGIYGLPGPYDCDASPGDCAEWYPTRNMWWWWATRMGSLWDVQEFPFFSFHFGDLHPHVLALPFVITAVAVAFQLFRSEERLDAGWPLRHPWSFLFMGAFIGGLAFLNLWDLPTFFFLAVAAVFGANWLRRRRVDLRTAWETAGFALPLAVLAVVMYLPFYVTFDSGTSGLKPVEAAFRPLEAPLNSTVTRPLHLLLFWTPLLWVGLPFAVSRLLRRGERRPDVGRALASVLPWLAPLVLWTAWVLVRRGYGGFAGEIETRGANLITVLMLTAAAAAATFAFVREMSGDRAAEGERRSYAFALLALGGGLLLVLGPELFFVDDNATDFRPNTVFKLWFQAWMLLSIAGAFGLYHLTRDWRFPRLALVGPPRRVAGRVAWAGASVAVLGAALVYTVTATMERTGAFGNEQRIDGYANILEDSPEEYEAVRWLNENVEGLPVMVEAVDRSYSRGARISTRTGIPTVLGWPGHERLWRGPGVPVSEREQDVRRIYETEDAEEARRLVEGYGVEYVYVGWLERAMYGLGEATPLRQAKFSQFMDVAFENDEVTIYRLTEPSAALTAGAP